LLQKGDTEMGDLLDVEAVTTKHGIPLDRSNPSVPTSGAIARTRRVQILQPQGAR
jgi:hypothetical protein